MEAVKLARGLWRRLRDLLDAGLDVMARYPYDMSELRWQPDFYDPPDSPDGGGSRTRSQPPGEPPSGRSIRAVRIVPPAVAPRQAETAPTPIASRRRKQPV
jgi:hypothetical protein